MRSVLMKLCGVFDAELLVYYQHRKFVSRAYEKTEHFASREGISRDAGHMGRNTGCAGKYGTVGNPSIGPACEAGLIAGMRREHVPSRKRKKMNIT